MEVETKQYPHVDPNEFYWRAAERYKSIDESLIKIHGWISFMGWVLVIYIVLEVINFVLALT